MIEKSEIKPLEERKVEKGFDKESLRDIRFLMDNFMTNPDSAIVDEEFSWVFVVKTQANIPEQEVNIIDEKTGATMQIEFKNGAQIKVGPFTCNKEGKFDKVFRLFFFNENCEMQYFGPKFGFSIPVLKSASKRLLVSSFRQKIEGVKKSFRVMRETEYIVERLRELGISEENYKESGDIIEDIIQTL